MYHRKDYTGQTFWIKFQSLAKEYFFLKQHNISISSCNFQNDLSTTEPTGVHWQLCHFWCVFTSRCVSSLPLATNTLSIRYTSFCYLRFIISLYVEATIVDQILSGGSCLCINNSYCYYQHIVLMICGDWKMGERGRGGVWIPIGMKDIFFFM